MHRIYSRTRILYVRKVTDIIAILAIAFTVVVVVCKAVGPVFDPI